MSHLQLSQRGMTCTNKQDNQCTKLPINATGMQGFCLEQASQTPGKNNVLSSWARSPLFSFCGCLNQILPPCESTNFMQRAAIPIKHPKVFGLNRHM